MNHRKIDLNISFLSKLFLVLIYRNAVNKIFGLKKHLFHLLKKYGYTVLF